MKNTKALIMIGVSVMVGLGAVFAAAQWVAKKSSMATARVVVAAKDLQVGTRLTPSALQIVDWPSKSTVKGSFSDIKALDARVVNTNMLSGEPLSESKLAPVGSQGGLSAVIAEGKRAMTVKVNEVVGVAGFALPGNFVDIMVNTQDEKSKVISKIVLEQILVLAVAQEQAVRDDTRAKIVSAVTLEVTPAQAEKLDLARSVGNLSLVLRNQIDRQLGATAGARPADLLGASAAPDAAAPAARTAPRPAGAKPAGARALRTSAPQVEIIRGVKRTSGNEAAMPQ
jgi:pilus assembly protein CpaB